MVWKFYSSVEKVLLSLHVHTKFDFSIFQGKKNSFSHEM